MGPRQLPTVPVLAEAFLGLAGAPAFTWEVLEDTLGEDDIHPLHPAPGPWETNHWAMLGGSSGTLAPGWMRLIRCVDHAGRHVNPYDITPSCLAAAVLRATNAAIGSHQLDLSADVEFQHLFGQKPRPAAKVQHTATSRHISCTPVNES